MKKKTVKKVAKKKVIKKKPVKKVVKKVAKKKLVVKAIDQEIVSETKFLGEQIPAVKPAIQTQKDNYSYETSAPAYHSEQGAKLIAMKLIEKLMEDNGGARTLKQLEEDLRAMKIYLPQSTISGRMSDLRDLGIVEYNDACLVYKGRKRKIFEIIPVSRRVKVEKTLKLMQRERKNRYSVLPAVANNTSVDPIEALPPVISAEPAAPVKEKKVRVVKEKEVKEIKEKTVKPQKSKLPTGAVESSFFD